MRAVHRCKRKSRATKRLTIHNAPAILTIQLKRFKMFVRDAKVGKIVEYPEKLALRPYLSAPDPSAIYSLYGVLVHSGESTHSGHYYCFIKSSAGMWHLMDDSRVAQVSQQKVLQQQAYILFYARDTPAAPAAATAQDVAATVPPRTLSAPTPAPTPTPAPAPEPTPTSLAPLPRPLSLSTPLQLPQHEVPLAAIKQRTVEFELNATRDDWIVTDLHVPAKTKAEEEEAEEEESPIVEAESSTASEASRSTVADAQARAQSAKQFTAAVSAMVSATSTSTQTKHTSTTTVRAERREVNAVLYGNGGRGQFASAGIPPLPAA